MAEAYFWFHFWWCMRCIQRQPTKQKNSDGAAFDQGKILLCLKGRPKKKKNAKRNQPDMEQRQDSTRLEGVKVTLELLWKHNTCYLDIQNVYYSDRFFLILYFRRGEKKKKSVELRMRNTVWKLKMLKEFKGVLPHIYWSEKWLRNLALHRPDLRSAAVCWRRTLWLQCKVSLWPCDSKHTASSCKERQQPFRTKLGLSVWVFKLGWVGSCLKVGF